MAKETDYFPRYAPNKVMTLKGFKPVTSYVFHQIAPAGVPILGSCLELKTHVGSRYYGCQEAYINSELRMVVKGFPARFEEMAKWERI